MAELSLIVKRCQNKEKEAFECLLKAVEKKALYVAYMLSGNRNIAEDILQETYIKCLKGIYSLKNPETFKVWFYKILVRTGWEMVKKHGKAIPMEMNGAENFSYNTSYDTSFESIETRNMIIQAINGLNKELKAVVVLYYFNDMSIEDISKVTGSFKSTIKTRLFNARKILKKDLMSVLGIELEKGGGIDG